MDVWAIVYGNGDPPELHSLWESNELAEVARPQLDDEAWRVIAVTSALRRTAMPGSPRDVRAPVWGKRVKKWKRWIEELRAEAGATVVLPEDFEIPPHRRIADTST